MLAFYHKKTNMCKLDKINVFYNFQFLIFIHNEIIIQCHFYKWQRQSKSQIIDLLIETVQALLLQAYLRPSREWHL